MGQCGELLPGRPDAGLDRPRADDPPLGRGHGREVFPQSGHRSGIRNLVVSPADATIFTAGTDGTIRHWDSTTGRELGVIARFDSAADTMAVSPDGKTLLVGGYLGGRRFALWSIAERREIRSLPRIEPRNPVRHVAFSPDGKTVASEWRIWDVATGQVLVTFRDRDEEKNRSANFFPIFYSPDGTQIITTEDEGVRIWDIRSGKEARWAVRAKIHHDQVALSPDGRYLATGGLVAHLRGSDPDPPIHLWELASGQEVATLEGHKESTRGLAFSPDGRLLASCSGGYRSSNDQTVRIWDVATGRELRRFQGHLGAVNAVAFTPDGRSVVSGSDDATVLVWDVSDLADHLNAAQPITDEGLRARWAELAGERRQRRLPRRLGAERPLGRRVPPRTPATRHGRRPRGYSRGEWADRATRGLADLARHRGTGAGGDARSPRRPRADGAGKPRRPRDPRREVGSQPLESPTGDSSQFLDQIRDSPKSGRTSLASPTSQRTERTKGVPSGRSTPRSIQLNELPAFRRAAMHPAPPPRRLRQE